MGVQLGFLTEEQLEQVWEEQGMRYRIDRFYRYLIDRGLLPMSVPADLFSDHIRNDILGKFLVKGVRELPDGQQRTDSD